MAALTNAAASADAAKDKPPRARPPSRALVLALRGAGKGLARLAMRQQLAQHAGYSTADYREAALNAAANGHSDVLRGLVEDMGIAGRITVDFLRSSKGNTLLHLALQHGYATTATVILRDLYPANFLPRLYRNCRGVNPVQAALANGHFRCVRAVWDHHYHSNRDQPFRGTFAAFGRALLHALSHEPLRVFRSFVEYVQETKWDVSRDMKSCALMESACESTHEPVKKVQCLLQHSLVPRSPWSWVGLARARDPAQRCAIMELLKQQRIPLVSAQGQCPLINTLLQRRMWHFCLSVLKQEGVWLHHPPSKSDTTADPFLHFDADSQYKAPPSDPVARAACARVLEVLCHRVGKVSQRLVGTTDQIASRWDVDPYRFPAQATPTRKEKEAVEKKDNTEDHKAEEPHAEAAEAVCLSAVILTAVGPAVVDPAQLLLSVIKANPVDGTRYAAALLAAGAPVNCVRRSIGAKRSTPLIEAAGNANIPMVSLLLSSGANPLHGISPALRHVYQTQMRRTTELHALFRTACYLNRFPHTVTVDADKAVSLARLLVRAVARRDGQDMARAYVDQRDRDDETALSLWLCTRHYSVPPWSLQAWLCVARALLDLGATASASDSNGLTLLHRAASQGPDAPPHAQERQRAAVRLLLHQPGVRVDGLTLPSSASGERLRGRHAPSGCGHTALHLAAWHCNKCVLQELLRAGARASLDAQDTCHRTAVHALCLRVTGDSFPVEPRHATEALRLLLQAGAATWLADQHGRTPYATLRRGNKNKNKSTAALLATQLAQDTKQRRLIPLLLCGQEPTAAPPAAAAAAACALKRSFFRSPICEPRLLGQVAALLPADWEWAWEDEEQRLQRAAGTRGSTDQRSFASWFT